MHCNVLRFQNGGAAPRLSPKPLFQGGQAATPTKADRGETIPTKDSKNSIKNMTLGEIFWETEELIGTSIIYTLTGPFFGFVIASILSLSNHVNETLALCLALGLGLKAHGRSGKNEQHLEAANERIKALEAQLAGKNAPLDKQGE